MMLEKGAASTPNQKNGATAAANFPLSTSALLTGRARPSPPTSTTKHTTGLVADADVKRLATFPSGAY